MRRRSREARDGTGRCGRFEGAITAFGDGENAWFVFHAAIGSLCLFYGLRGAYRVRGK